tara:strand:+ start:510 stop:917 length:408 start_codon:yes stop_codon:yes gene_type:complete
MNINIINKDNIYLLKKFIKLNDSDFFRYYHSRTVDVIKNHIVTIVLTLNDNIIGYGHLDYEKKVWLGICILQEYRKQGYSKIILEFLFDYALKKNIKEINLSLDKNNIIAKYIYEKYDFKVIDIDKKIYFMKKVL